MQFKLKVVHGALKRVDGRSLGSEIPVVGRYFVIGTARDCHMRCSGQSISPYHCTILIQQDRVVVRDDASQGGTFVNGERINTTACLFHGDRLRIGKLEFDVVIPAVTLPVRKPVALPLSGRETIAPTDTVAGLMVDMLLNTDEAERERRRFDPASREYHPAAISPATSENRAASPTARARVPVKRPPAKLPAPPPIRGQATIEAAQQALSHLITQAARKQG